MADTKLYELLGLSPSASYNDVRKQYRRLAKECHPDKNPAAGDKFKEISFAYEILSNPQKREIYDRYGLEGLKEGHGGDMFSSADDIFSSFFGGGPLGGFFSNFGGGFGGMRGGRRMPRKGDTTVHKLKVSLEDLYNGKVSKLQLSKNVICAECGGAGGRHGALQTCRTCSGRGVKVTVTQLGPGMVQQMQSRCPDCDGEGEVINERDRCPTCLGRKVTQQTKLLEVHIEKGMKDEQQITFHGEGDQMPGVEPGDVLIILQEKTHPRFQRIGLDLYLKHSVTLTEALCGFTMAIEHLDGRTLSVSHPPGSIMCPGTVKGIPGEGMPVYKNVYEKGILFIKFDVIFPDKYFALDQQLKELESLIGGRSPVSLPDEYEDVNMEDFDPHERGRSQHAYDAEEEHRHGMGGTHVQCGHQ